LAARNESGEQGGKVNFAYLLKNLRNPAGFNYQVMEKSVSSDTDFFENKEKYGAAISTQI
jgi:hypothetical protein